MLKTRQHQADAVAASAFVERAVTHLRRFYPNAVASLSELELQARVIHCLARGRAHGLTWESIHRQELSWTSPSALGNSNGEPRAVFHDPPRGLSGGQ